LFILNLQVTFSNPVEAESAMTSPDAVMGNRFIKVFYHHESKTATVVPLKERVGTKASRIRPAQCKQTKNDVFQGQASWAKMMGKLTVLAFHPIKK
jgi:hypothetical protein